MKAASRRDGIRIASSIVVLVIVLIVVWLVIPAIGFATGYAAKAWSLVVVVAVLCLAADLASIPLDWFGDQDTPALGGAIIFAVVAELPGLGFLTLGVWAGRSRAFSRRWSP